METDIELRASSEAADLAAALEMHPDKIDELRMAVQEACINACEHSKAEDRRIYLRFSLVGDGTPDRIQVEVGDHGVGFSPEAIQGRMNDNKEKPRKRGWGLLIMRRMMDDVTIRSSAGGTTVIMSKRV